MVLCFDLWLGEGFGSPFLRLNQHSQMLEEVPKRGNMQ